MPTDVVLSRVNGRVRRNGEWSNDQDVSEHVEVVKLVFGFFVTPLGGADAWTEVVLGNDHDRPLRVTAVKLEFENPDPALSLAPSTTTRTDDFPDGYLWLESDETWQRMYEDYEPLGGEVGFFERRATTPEDGPFAYTLGSGEAEQRVVSTPVGFAVPDSPAQDDNRTLYEVSEFRTLHSDVSPVLYPKEEVATDVPSTEQYREHVDAISFWCKWDADDLTTNLGTGEFALGFRCESEAGPTSHVYTYYTLPPNGQLTGSRSAVEVRSWRPDETRWMFAEWRDRYGVERAGTREGTDRMTRSKVRGAATVYNDAQYQVPTIRSIDSAARWALGFVYIITASIALQYYFDNPSTPRLAGSALAVVLLLMLGVWTHQTSITPVTRLLYWLQSLIPSVRR